MRILSKENGASESTRFSKENFHFGAVLFATFCPTSKILPQLLKIWKEEKKIGTMCKKNPKFEPKG